MKPYDVVRYTTPSARDTRSGAWDKIYVRPNGTVATLQPAGTEG